MGARVAGPATLLAMAVLTGCISNVGWPPPDQTSKSATYRPPRPRRAPIPEWSTAATSREGRPIQTLRMGNGAWRVLWIGGIHGNEVEGTVATQELPEVLASKPSLLAQLSVTMVQDLNPDGRAAKSRYNANGIDLNRNFPARNFKPSRVTGNRPLSEPESRYLHKLVTERRPDLVFVCHSTGKRKFINYDGPCRKLAIAFAKASGYPVVPSKRLHATPGSLGSWIGLDQKIPILTIEWQRGMSSRTAWNETQDAILAAMEKLAAGKAAGDQ